MAEVMATDYVDSCDLTFICEDALNLFSDEVGSKDGSTQGRSSDNDRESERNEVRGAHIYTSNVLVSHNSPSSTETSRPKSNARHSPTAPTASTTTLVTTASAPESERVLIIVEVAGGESEARGFRIKREHTIYTVLKGASKSFNLDVTKLVVILILWPSLLTYSCFRAVLKKVVEDDDGELSFIKCNSTDTMRSLQIEDGQRFIIDPTESEESEESED